MSVSLLLGVVALPARAQGRITATPLLVVTDGVRFEIEAAAFRMAKGWGVSVTITASSDDGLSHGINNDPIHFAGRTTKGWVGTGWDEGSIGAVRVNGRPWWAHTIAPGAGVEFRRSIPDGGIPTDDPAAEFGESLELSVGISCMEAVGSERPVAPDLAIVRLAVDESGSATIAILPAPPRP